MAGMSDFSFSTSMRDVISKLIDNRVAALRPEPKYATVAEIDIANRRCGVIFTGEQAAVYVSMGAIQPQEIGQIVRIEGTRGDRFIADVIGSGFLDGSAASALLADSATSAGSVQGQDLGLNTNLNNITEPGVYWQPTSARATLALNYPATDAGLLEVFNSNGSHIWQRYTMFGSLSNKVYMRAFYLFENTWSAWSLTTGGPESGWVNLTPASGWASNPTSTQRYCSARRVGPTVRFRGLLTGTLTVNTTITIATVPVSLRPSSGSNSCAIVNSGGFVGWGNVTDTGSVAVHFKTPWATGTATIDLTGFSYTLDA